MNIRKYIFLNVYVYIGLGILFLNLDRHKVFIASSEALALNEIQFRHYRLVQK